MAERVAVYRSLDWSAPHGGETATAEVPYLPCHLWPLLLKDKHDVSNPRASSPTLFRFSFAHAGHIDRHQRPVDPVLVRTAAHEHEGCGDDSQGCSHASLLGGTLARRVQRQGGGGCS